MKILNDLSIKDLKLNKKRSLVIIIGIILSTALICGVAGIVTSFQHSIVNYYKENSGNFHAIFYEVPKSELKYVEENRNVNVKLEGGKLVLEIINIPIHSYKKIELEKVDAENIAVKEIHLR